MPKTPNLKEYFVSLNRFKRLVFLLTIFLFLSSGTFFAIGVYSSFLPVQSQDSSKALTSPTDFFGRASKTAGQPVTGPKTVPSPLNGVFYTEAEAAEWRSRRPMAVVINNHLLARPQFGLAQADVVYEAVAEGGITRFLAIFHAQAPERVGPVRSARKYYVDFAKENDAWFAHWGGAQTTNEANVYDYMRGIFVSSIDAMWAGAQAFWRDFSRDVPTEHTGFTSIPQLYETGYQQYPDQVRELRPLPSNWLFKDEVNEAERPEAASVEFNFWDLPDFAVAWQYDKSTNSYQRSQGGQPHTDGETGQALTAKNVVVLFMEERSLNDGKGHLLYQTLGEGVGKAFLDGQVLDIRWVRKGVKDRIQFYLVTKGVKKGAEKPLELNRGQVWVEILATGTPVNFE